MAFKDTPIQRKLMSIILCTSIIVLAITCITYFIYELLTYKQSMVRQLTTLAVVVGSNSSAALAFQNQDEANEILSALSSVNHVVGAGLYDKNGILFTRYPSTLDVTTLPVSVMGEGYQFESSHLIVYQPVIQGEKRLGTLLLKSNMQAMYNRFKLLGVIASIVIVVSLLVAYLISKFLQSQLAQPVISLAETARLISINQNYSVRAKKFGNDELGQLTDAFNQMLGEIERQNREIIMFNQNLEQKVIERTQELEFINKELEKANNELGYANKEMEAFSYMVSHDLRSPLRFILLYSSMILESHATALNEELTQLIHGISAKGRKMADLIKDLLVFSKLSKGQLEKQSIVMKAMVETICDELKKMEDTRDIEIKIGNLPTVCADPPSMQQVWSNLVSNALKYTRLKSKAIISIDAEITADFITYYIHDNGSGFDMKYYNKLFGVFQRLHSNSEFEGTGLGLAIVERVISKHGGKVWATSKLDEGSTFCFTLPQ